MNYYYCYLSELFKVVLYIFQCTWSRQTANENLLGFRHHLVRVKGEKTKTIIITIIIIVAVVHASSYMYIYIYIYIYRYYNACLPLDELSWEMQPSDQSNKNCKKERNRLICGLLGTVEASQNVHSNLTK